MKIRDVKAMALTTGSIFVRVETDVDGLVGWGECSPMNADVLEHFVNTALRPRLIGEDPREIDRLWHAMFFGTYKLGVMGVQPEAIAGVDIALWDILGKSTGLPVAVLLGGVFHESIPMYRSIGGGSGMTPAEMSRTVVAEGLKKGFKAAKIRMDWTAARRDIDIAKDLEMARVVRDTVGEDFVLGFDSNNGYAVASAIKFGRELEALGYAFFEEPIAQYDYAGMARVVAALDIPISAGEHEYTRWQFRDLIEQARVDILQPDVVKCAGITEMKRIATLGSTHNKDFMPHQTQPTLGTAANLHVLASLPHLNLAQEYTGNRPELDEVFVEPLEFRDGRLTVPREPGLGLEVDERKLARLLR